MLRLLTSVNTGPQWATPENSCLDIEFEWRVDLIFIMNRAVTNLTESSGETEKVWLMSNHLELGEIDLHTQRRKLFNDCVRKEELQP